MSIIENFSLDPETRSRAVDEYIRLDRPTMKRTKFLSLPNYEGVLEEGDALKLKQQDDKVPGSVVYVLNRVDGKCVLQGYRLE